MSYKDLREWIDKLEKEKELVRVKKEVDWNLEIGGILREVCDRGGPALLFEKNHQFHHLIRRDILKQETKSSLTLGLGEKLKTSVCKQLLVVSA